MDQELYTELLVGCICTDMVHAE